MNFLQPYISDALAKALGWTFLHALWIGALLGVIFLGVQWLLRYKSANLRYLSGLGFMLLMPLLVTIAFVHAYQHESRLFAGTPVNYGISAGPGGPVLSASETNSTVQVTEWLALVKESYFEKYHSVLVGLWLTGIALFSLHYLGGYFYTKRLRRIGLSDPDGEVLQLFNSILANTAVRRHVRLFESFLVNAPVVIGTFRPMVLLPVGLAAGLTIAEIEAILAHEIAHIRRNDFLVNILQSCIEVVFFFHPAIWLIGAAVRAEREHCCDDLAVAMNGDRVSLAKALAYAEEWRVNQHSNTFALGFSGQKNSLLNRIKRIINNKNMKTQHNEGTLLGNLLVIAIIAGLALTTLTSLKSAEHPLFQNSDAEVSGLADTVKAKEKNKVKDKAKDKEKNKAKDKATDKSTEKNKVVVEATEAGTPAMPAAVAAPAVPSAEPTPSIPAVPGMVVNPSPAVMIMPGAMAMASADRAPLRPIIAGFPPMPPVARVPLTEPGATFAIDPGRMHFYTEDTFEIDGDWSKSHEEFARQMAEFAEDMAAVQSEIGQELAARAAEMSQMAAEIAKLGESMHSPRAMNHEHEELARHQQEMAREQAELVRHHAEMEREMGERYRKDMERHEEEMRKHRVDMERMDREMREHEKKVQAFEKDLRSELEKDGIINAATSKLELKIRKDELIINGQKQSKELYEKYHSFIKNKWDSSINLDNGESDEFSLSFSF